MTEDSYSLAKNIVADLEGNLESLFQRLSICRKQEVSIVPEILVQIIENNRPLPPSKVLAMQLLVLNLDSLEQKGETAQLMSSVRFMFRVSEILRADIQENMQRESSTPPPHTATILEIFTAVFGKLTQSEKDTMLTSMEEAGIFLLINVWSSSYLLKMYSSLLSGMVNHEKDKKNNKRSESMPYRTLVEESVFSMSSVLVHRRDPSYFMPKYFRIEPEITTKVYDKIFAFQDEYEVVHKSLMNWCEGCGDLRGVEWVTAWHLQNLSQQIDNGTYEKEILFVLGAMFYSSVQNTLSSDSLENVNLFKVYLGVIKACKTSSSPSIKGVASVASQRLTSQSAKYFMSTISSAKTSKKQKAISLYGLSTLCNILLDGDLLGVKKIVEKQAGSILELVEIEPEGAVTLHCTAIINVLSVVDKVPVPLFSPSKMCLVLWILEHGEIKDKKAKYWLAQYMSELASVFSPAEDNSIARALCF
ncbi:hypothetical protein NEMIN01_1097 [Nematocida minor]|uniref:uncharacterized protein n=1 Tax=Nematocida minor TaxID=1912983 RepID=UPI00221F7FFF|nr:uncharacterized protein NEMIN01_1097 [Nematocida minor]KAI5190559.1 hypothetical protein NEMIN01_1097 [Nematocida minor]